MARTVVLRDFEDRDIDFIYRCKNDKELNKMIVGLSQPISYEEATQWVHNCMKGDRPDLKFWAIGINDIEKRIIGWISLSEIDLKNRSACHHGLVIGDKSYKDGSAMFEAMFLSMEYAFEKLKVHRLYGSSLSEHKTTPAMMRSLGFTIEGKRRDAFLKNGDFFDLLDYSILDYEFRDHLEKGDYTMSSLIKSFIKNIRKP